MVTCAEIWLLGGNWMLTENATPVEAVAGAYEIDTGMLPA
jgi:hypothetical protein